MDQKKLRTHVGVHILKTKIANVCGFCGLQGCSVTLIVASGRGNTATMAASSNCEYLIKFSLKAAARSMKTGPCTNTPVVCPHGKDVQWSYNMEYHYKNKHSDHPTPNMVTDDERRLMGL